MKRPKLKFPKISIGALPCKSICHHPLHRWHISCFYCRIRRLFYGTRDGLLFRKLSAQRGDHYNKYMGIVMPQRQQTYVLLIDCDRHMKVVKEILLKRVLELAEMLAN